MNLLCKISMYYLYNKDLLISLLIPNLLINLTKFRFNKWNIIFLLTT